MRQDALRIANPEEAEWRRKYSESLQQHIKAVQEAGKMLGIHKTQLRYHDTSKWSKQEFPYYARQFHGDKADPTGFAHAWNHHIHNNPHHPEHWKFSDTNLGVKGAEIESGGLLVMPEKYALEMIADWIGSSFVYTGGWEMAEWLKKNYYKKPLHTTTRKYADRILADLGYGEIVYEGT